MSVMLITHDLGVVAGVADKVIVMYAGKIMEYGDIKSLFSSPLHPYTRGLMDSIPKIDSEERRLKSIAGTLPNLMEHFTGCRFASRCGAVKSLCRIKEPSLVDMDGQSVRCFLYSEGERD